MKVFKQCIATAAVMLASSGVLAQNPATIPASLEGKYKVTFNRMVNYGVLPDGTELTMVIAPGGGLCLAQYIVGNPEIRDGSPYEDVVSIFQEAQSLYTDYFPFGG